MQSGTRISHYDIEAELGRGGMGIVYRAHDTKLDRTVAIKVLPSGALASQGDRDRFYREAKSAAQLHHPNIASVFEIDEAVPEDAPHGTQPSPFIAMEFISGATLQERIEQAPLPLEEAVQIASQVAEALKAAHAKDIVHRDIKSANVMMTDEGVAKVLDFGLAKTSQSTMLTRMGSTLGTVSYMSPEQARGEEVDGRTDLWALGVLLYEMIAGRLPFAGDYEQAVTYSILNEDPQPLTALRTGVPMSLDWIVSKLLAKKAADRYQSTTDLLVDLRNADLKQGGLSRVSTSTSAMPAAAPAEPAHSSRPSFVLPAVLLVAGLALGWILANRLQPEELLPVRYYTQPFSGMLETRWPAISEDGRYLAIGGQDSLANGASLHLWDLETNRRSTIPNSSFPEWPVFSPDGSQIAFISGGKLKIAGVNGSEPVEVASASPEMVQWHEDGSIFFLSPGIELQRATPNGRIEPVMSADSALTGHYLNAIIGNDIILARNEPNGKVSAWVMDLDNGEMTKLLDDNVWYLRYMDSGHLVVQTSQNGQLVAFPYSASDREITGLAQPFQNGVDVSEWFGTRSGYLAITLSSGNGVLEMVALDADGTARRLLDASMNFEEFQFTPSGEGLIAEINGYENGSDQLLLFDLATGLSRQITYSIPHFEPSISPDGSRVVFAAPHVSAQNIGIRNMDGTGDVEWVTENQMLSGDPDWAPTGDFLVFDQSSADTDFDIWRHDFSEGRTEVLIDEPGSQMYPRVSSDGRFVAYQSNQTRETEVWVVDLQTDVRTRVTRSGGLRPMWGRGDSKLYYSTGAVLMSVDVSTRGGFSVTGQPRVEMEVGAGFYFDVSEQGAVAIAKQTGSSAASMQIIQNWPATLE